MEFEGGRIRHTSSLIWSLYVSNYEKFRWYTFCTLLWDFDQKPTQNFLQWLNWQNCCVGISRQRRIVMFERTFVPFRSTSLIEPELVWCGRVLDENRTMWKGKRKMHTSYKKAGWKKYASGNTDTSTFPSVCQWRMAMQYNQTHKMKPVKTIIPTSLAYANRCKKTLRNSMLNPKETGNSIVQ